MSGGIGVSGGDRAASFREALLALLVPADQYRKHGPNVTRLLPAAVWTGAASRSQPRTAPPPPGPTRFLATLPSENHVMLASFDERVLVHAEADAGPDRIRLALWQMDRRAGTRLYDAVALVGRRAQTLGDRKGIVLLTDGVDTRSRLADAESTLQAAGQSHVPVYVIQYDTTRNDYALPSGVRSGGMDIRDMAPVVLPGGALDNRALFERAHAYLAALTDRSGGRLYRADSLPNLNQAFAQVVRDLGDQYTLGYYPTNQAHDGTYRKLRVEVDRPGVAVRARAGYWAATR
jgi:VWFA-related protein